MDYTGCGKTMMMDMFYDTAPVESKRRVHFHAFMLDVHARLHTARATRTDGADNDPIVPLARDLHGTGWLLCFDEFQVTDVADAMIIKRLFSQLWSRGTVVVATSNRPPDDLYLNGLQRELFLPFIAELKQRCDVHHVLSPIDYRLSGEQASSIFISPLGPRASSQLQDVVAKLTDNRPGDSDVLLVNGRRLQVPWAAKGLCRFSFHDLCEKPLGAADYIAIAQNYHTLVLSDVPQLTLSHRNEARRFITLIDELYDHRVKLICSAAAPPEELFVWQTDVHQIPKPVSAPITPSKGASTSHHAARLGPLVPSRRRIRAHSTQMDEEFSFDRTLSRLTEMQTHGYLSSTHLPNK